VLFDQGVDGTRSDTRGAIAPAAACARNARLRRRAIHSRKPVTAKNGIISAAKATTMRPGSPKNPPECSGKMLDTKRRPRGCSA
jgi:hypothetical protein